MIDIFYTILKYICMTYNVWTHRVNLTPQLGIAISVPSQGSDHRPYIYVLVVSFFFSFNYFFIGFKKCYDNGIIFFFLLLINGSLRETQPFCLYSHYS